MTFDQDALLVLRFLQFLKCDHWQDKQWFHLRNHLSVESVPNFELLFCFVELSVKDCVPLLFALMTDFLPLMFSITGKTRFVIGM